MEILYFLEKIRTPFLDSFFSVITRFGEETIFIVLGILVFWCVNKKEGYYLLCVGFMGTVLNQFLKLWFRIPRPWVKDPNFTIVSSAKSGATGYSFPSGHTQSSVGLYGGIARFNRQKWIRIVGISLCILVPFSRLYLGVHTPLDVGVSLIIALALVFGLHPVFQCSKNNTLAIRLLLILVSVLSCAYLCFVLLFPFPQNIDSQNLAHGTENAYKMVGCAIGFFLSFEVDQRFIHFETGGNAICQVLKSFFGLAIVLAIKSGLKAPLYAVFGGNIAADGVRYFLIAVVAGCLWPMTFGLFRKITKSTVSKG